MASAKPAAAGGKKAGADSAAGAEHLPVGYAPIPPAPPASGTGKHRKKKSGHKAASNQAAASSSSSSSNATPAVAPDDFLVRKFADMGFDSEAAKPILIITRNDFEKALAMLEASGAVAAPAAPVPDRKDPTRNDAHVAQLTEMGFSIEHAREALRETDGNLERAIEILVTRAGPDASASYVPPLPAAATARPSVPAARATQPPTSAARAARAAGAPAAIGTGRSSAPTPSMTWAGPVRKAGAPTAAAPAPVPAPAAPAAAAAATAAAAAAIGTGRPTAAKPPFQVGDLCEGRFTEDDVWYLAKIESVSADGKQFTVVYPEYGNRETIGLDRLRPRPTAAAPAPAPAPAPTFKVGDLCEGQYTADDVWYAARILSISPDGQRFKVHYTEYGNEEELPLSRLRRLPTAAPAAAPTVPAAATYKVGDVVEGQFTEDDVWYKANVLRVSPDGSRVHVRYTEYGNEEELPLSRVRAVGGVRVAAAAAPTAPAAGPAAVAPAVPAAATYKVGDVVEGQYTEDNVWYQAKVLRVSPDGSRVFVHYTEYGNEEELPLSRVRRPAAPATPAAPAAAPAPAPAAKAPAAARAPTVAPKVPAAFKVGDVCEGQYTEDNVWYAARILSVSPDGQRFKVHYTEYGNEEELPLSRLRPLPPSTAATAPAATPAAAPAAAPAPAAAFRVGQQVEGQYTEDDVWYPAVVEQVAADGSTVQVLYTEYGNRETLPLSRVRARGATAPAPAEKPAEPKAPVAAAPVPAPSAPAAAVPAAAAAPAAAAGTTPAAPAAPAVPTAPVVATLPNGATVRVGDLVEALFPGLSGWHRAVVISLNADLRTAQLTNIATGQQDMVAWNHLRVAAPAAAAGAPPPGALTAAAAAAPQAPTFPLGAQVEARYSGDGQWYRALITKVAPNGGRYTVTFVEYGNSEEVPPSDVRPLPGAPAPTAAPVPTALPAAVAVPATASVPTLAFAENDVVEAQYTADNMWYAAKVTKVGPAGVEVLYLGYSTTELLPPSRVRPILAPGAGAARPREATAPTANGAPLDKDGRPAAAAVAAGVPPAACAPTAAARLQAAKVLQAAAAAAASTQFRVGDHCEALYVDGLWYDAIITAINPSSISIVYSDYGTPDEKPFEHVRAKARGTPAAGGAPDAGKAAAARATLPTGAYGGAATGPRVGGAAPAASPWGYTGEPLAPLAGAPPGKAAAGAGYPVGAGWAAVPPAAGWPQPR